MNLERIGRSRLKLKLPALRALIDAQQSRAFRALCEEYALAAMARDELTAALNHDSVDLDGLDTVCAEIESDVDLWLRTPNLRRVASEEVADFLCIAPTMAAEVELKGFDGLQKVFTY